MLEWDKENRPVGYVVGGTTGETQITKEYQYIGIAGKLAKGIKMGYDFMEVDAWTSAELFEPTLKQRIDQLRASEENLNIGIHADVKMDLTVPFGMQWKIHHDKLVTVMLGAAEVVKSRFILFHTSTTPIPEFGTAAARSASAPLLAPNGKNLGEFVKEESKNGEFNLKEWIKLIFPKMFFSAMGAVANTDIVQELDKWRKEDKADNFDEKYRKELKRAEDLLDSLNKKISLRISNVINEVKRLENEGAERSKIEAADRKLEEEKQVVGNEEWNNLNREEKKLVQTLPNRGTKGMYYDEWDDTFNYWVSQGSQGEEQSAYHIIAKWMYKNKDPLWAEIVGNKDPDEIVDEVDKRSGKITPDLRQMVSAVAAKYIQGHLDYGMYRFEQIDIKTEERKEDLPLHTEIEKIELSEKEEQTSVYEYGRKHGVHIYLETPMHVAEREGDMKIMAATDHIKIVRIFHQYFGGANVSYNFDFEHLVTNHMNPGKEIAALGKEDGKYVTMIHILPPRPIEGTHAIIHMFSRDMYLLYKWLWGLKNKGMKDAYFIWEVGAYQGVYESPIAIRKFKEFLLKNIPPNELPPEFFGIDKDLEAAQKTTIIEHGLDPVKGLFIVPEEDHTALSKAATEKGKAEIWKKKKFV